MLYFILPVYDDKGHRTGWTRDIQWHVGEPLPQDVTKERIVKLQADGDELELLLLAITFNAKKEDQDES